MNLKSIVFAEMPINFNESTYQAAFFGCNKFIETQILTKTQLNRFKHLLTQPGRQTFLKVFGGLHVHLVNKNANLVYCNAFKILFHGCHFGVFFLVFFRKGHHFNKQFLGAPCGNL